MTSVVSTTPSGRTSAPRAEAGASPVSLNLAIALALAIAATVFSSYLCSKVDPEIFKPYADNVWFHADTKRVLENMTDAQSSHLRNKVHPIASLITYPLVRTVAWLTGSSPSHAALHVTALSAGLFTALLYGTLVAIGLPIRVAAAFVLLAGSSAASIMFSSIPELYPLGAVSMTLVLLAAARAAQGRFSETSLVLVSAASLSMTVTNWMAGVLYAFTHLPWQQALKRTAQALAIVVVLALLQKALFPTSGLFFLGAPEESRFIAHRESGSLADRLVAMFMHGIVLPELRTVSAGEPFIWDRLSVQSSVPGSHSIAGALASVVWLVLLVAGGIGAARMAPQWKRFRLVLFGALAGQVLLHSIYGEETFLYSLHLLPFLVTFAALSWFSPMRRFVLPLVLMTSVLALSNNLSGFSTASRHLAQSVGERERMERVAALRPDGVWPRRAGHVVLGAPGGPMASKGIHTPGGSFSPAPGSFAVSVWVLDGQGRVAATSDTIPLDKLRQEMGPVGPAGVPSLRTSTDSYTATWSHEGPHFRLEVATAGNAWLLVRSAGPSGGPIRTLTGERSRLVVNERWALIFPATSRVAIGQEGERPIALDTARPLTGTALRADDADGWLYAAVQLPAGSTAIELRDLHAAARAAPALPPAIGAYWRPEVPDARFRDMAYAQQAHLLMGLTDGQTRPGDPVLYDFEWIRDGAYILAALAKAGQAQAAAMLARSIADKDFVGGFGAEADAPGLAVWALAEAARAIDRDDFVAWAWPHVQRKAELILRCLDAKEPLVAPASGPVLRDFRDGHLTHRPCGTAMDGLAVGSMDLHHPILFVNAVNHLGLREAAALAHRMGRSADAQRYANRADAVAAAWRSKFMMSPRDTAIDLLRHGRGLAADFMRERVGMKSRVMDWIRARENERTYIAGLWPSGVVGAAPALRSEYQAQLEVRWRKERTAEGGFRVRPAWTYFAFAEAHQWLRLGQPARAWETLEYFMQSPASPGLYTWWEEGSSANASLRWSTIRGRADPGSIQPHYWSAAEALMLQMDMLAYVDTSDPARPLVVGAGVLPQWLAHPIDSGTLVTEHGPVRWTWRDGELTIHTARKGIPLRIAPVFGATPAVAVHLDGGLDKRKPEGDG